MENEPIASCLGSLPPSPAAPRGDKPLAADDVVQPEPGFENHGNGTDASPSLRSVSGDEGQVFSSSTVSVTSPSSTDIEKVPKEDAPITNGASPSNRMPATVDVNGKAVTKKVCLYIVHVIFYGESLHDPICS